MARVSLQVDSHVQMAIVWDSAEDIDNLISTLKKAKRKAVYPFIYCIKKEIKGGKSC